MSFFWLYPGFKTSSKHNCARKNLFLNACFCWDFRLFLCEMDQKYKFCGTIDWGDSYLDFLFRLFKVIRLHAKLHDAAGAVPAHSGKGQGYCYLIGRGLNSCLLSRVTRLLFRLYVKLVLPSIFNCVDLWSSMSCIVLDIELFDKNFFKELGVPLKARFRDTHFVIKKSTNPQNKRFGEPKNCMELCGTVDVWITVGFHTFFLEL